jgi:enoyl-CoA hydratase/carnithine racemase
VNTGAREGFARGLAAESAAFRENIVSRDAREGVDAFLAGRKPVFGG